MTDSIKTIAIRIQDLREITGLTQTQVAQSSGIELADYIAYEKGERDFSFSHLFNIASTLGVDISDLLTGESPKLHGYILTRDGQGLAFERRKAYLYQHLAYNFKDKKAEPFIVTVKHNPAETSGKTAHAHDGQEFNYVLQGKMMIELGGNQVFLNEGDSLYYDSSIPHAMYALESDARFIAVVIK